jgi:hypothetical protein
MQYDPKLLLRYYRPGLSRDDGVADGSAVWPWLFTIFPNGHCTLWGFCCKTSRWKVGFVMLSANGTFCFRNHCCISFLVELGAGILFIFTLCYVALYIPTLSAAEFNTNFSFYHFSYVLIHPMVIISCSLTRFPHSKSVRDETVLSTCTNYN